MLTVILKWAQTLFLFNIFKVTPEIKKFFFIVFRSENWSVTKKYFPLYSTDQKPFCPFLENKKINVQIFN